MTGGELAPVQNPDHAVAARGDKNPGPTIATTADKNPGEAVAAAAEGVLSDAGYRSPKVSIVGAPSAGAVRATLLVEITTDGDVIPAVVQVGMADVGVRSLAYEDEAALVRIAALAGLPVAEVLAVCNKAASIDKPLMVSRRVDGLTIPRHVLRLLDKHPGAGEALGAQCGSVLAGLHTIDTQDVPPTVPRDDLDATCAAYVKRLGGWLDELGQPNPVLRYGLNWLADNPPSVPASRAIVHGDFRNGNLIIGDPAGSVGSLRAVIDWELAHLGDPMEDLAYLCLRTWRFGNDDRPVGGFASLASLRTAYEHGGGAWRQDSFDWWTIARTAWWGIGLTSQAAAFTRGDSRSIVHAASGRRVVEMEYDLLTLIGERLPG